MPTDQTAPAGDEATRQSETVACLNFTRTRDGGLQIAEHGGDRRVHISAPRVDRFLTELLRFVHDTRVEAGEVTP